MGSAGLRSRTFVSGAVLAAALATMVTARAAQPQRTPSDPAVIAAFDALEAYVAALPDAMLNGGQRRSLIAKLENAEARYRAGQLCTAWQILGAFLNETQALRRGARAATAEGLYNRGRALRSSFFDIFTDSNLEPPRCFEPAQGRAPEVVTLASDNTHFSAQVTFGAPEMQTVAAGGETWTQLQVPGLQSEIGAPGMPAVPTWQALVAVPRGAEALLLPAVRTAGETIHLNLYPFQAQAFDQEQEEPIPPPETFADRPFAKDERTYATDALLPPDPCAVRSLGLYRDVQMIQVECAAGQYNPATDQLTLFRSVQFDVQFRGGEGTFVTTQTLSPFEEASNEVMASTLNSAVLANYVKAIDLSILGCLGEELLVLTHPDFRAAADDLAQWKRDKGISTTVINVGSGTPYDTAAEIDDLIEDRYDDCMVRPSYVLLVGDSEFIPPARTDYDVADDATTGSDWGYAIYVQILFDAFFADFAVGRIPVDTATEAQTVVDKVIQYESNPPFLGFFNGAPFYTTASFASQFQCCRMNQNGSPLNGQAGTDQRSFIQTSELGRDTLMASGYTGERIYVETIDNGGYCLVNQDPCPNNQIQMPYNGNATPNRYYNGTLLPVDLRSGSGFPWNGSTQDVIDAFNDGRFLVVHRDHGGASGWGNPGFGTGNLGSLTNGALLPVVYSVNCKSGYFDRETDGGGSSESFMEQMLFKSGGGMVGGLGDVRNSPTWPNSALTRGFIDATWPNLAPEFGGGTVHRRLGDILNHGKVYLVTQIGVAQPAGSVSLDAAVDELIMWHAFGDPTLELWTANPHRLTLPLEFVLAMERDRAIVQYAQDGAEITALQPTREGMIPVGRAMVINGMAELMFFHPPEPGQPLMLTASLANAVSVLLTRGALPDLIVQHLAAPAGVLPGQDLAGILGIRVGNLGPAAGAGTIDGTGAPKPPGVGYMIDVVLSRDASMPPGFATVPLPEGVAFVEDGLLKSGRVSRTPDIPGSTPGLALSPLPPISSDVGGVIPLQTPPGDYYLCARIDPGDAVTESDETNNVHCVPMTVLPPLKD